jgi:hypothetical protein
MVSCFSFPTVFTFTLSLLVGATPNWCNAPAIKDFFNEKEILAINYSGLGAESELRRLANFS